MFPPEIVELFIQEMVDAKANLSPLLLVSRAFYHPARKAIFSKIKLQYRPVSPNPERLDKPTDSQRLLGALNGDQALIHIIKALVIWFSIWPADDRDRARELDDPRSQTRYEDSLYSSTDPDPSFIMLLGLLAKSPLVSLSLQQTLHDPSVFQFRLDHLSDRGVQALVALRHIPTLREFTIDRLAHVPYALVVGDPLNDTLSSLTVPHHFSLDDDTIPSLVAKYSTPTSPRYAPFQQLEKLNIHHLHMFSWYICGLEVSGQPLLSEAFAKPSRLPALRILRAGYGPGFYPETRIVDAIQYTPALEEFICRANFTMILSDDAKCHLSTICSLPSMRILTIEHDYPCNADNTLVRSLIPLLGELTHTALNTISISASWSIRLGELDRVLDPLNAWLDLRDTITQIATLRALLLSIRIRIKRKRPKGKGESSRRGRLAAALAVGLSVEGRLKVVCTITPTKSY